MTCWSFVSWTFAGGWVWGKPGREHCECCLQAQLSEGEGSAQALWSTTSWGFWSGISLRGCAISSWLLRGLPSWIICVSACCGPCNRIFRRMDLTAPVAWAIAYLPKIITHFTHQTRRSFSKQKLRHSAQIQNTRCDIQTPPQTSL